MANHYRNKMMTIKLVRRVSVLLFLSFQSWCAAVVALHNLLSAASVMSQAAIAFDRFHTIVNCLEYTSHYSTSYLLKGFTTIYIPALVLGMTSLGLSRDALRYLPRVYICGLEQNGEDGVTAYQTCFAVFAFCIPSFVMIYCYMRIIFIARRHLRCIADIKQQALGSTRTDVDNRATRSTVNPRSAIAFAVVDPIQRLSLFPEMGGKRAKIPEIAVKDADSDASSASSFSTNYRKEARTTLRLLGLVGLLCICWLPYHVISIVYVVGIRTWFTPLLYNITYTLTFATGVVNPILYALGSRRFRHSLKKCFRGKTSKRRSGRKSKNQKCAAQIATLYRSSHTDNGRSTAGDKIVIDNSNLQTRLTAPSAESGQALSNRNVQIEDIPNTRRILSPTSYDDSLGESSSVSSRGSVTGGIYPRPLPPLSPRCSVASLTSSTTGKYLEIPSFSYVEMSVMSRRNTAPAAWSLPKKSPTKKDFRKRDSVDHQAISAASSAAVAGSGRKQRRKKKLKRQRTRRVESYPLDHDSGHRSKELARTPGSEPADHLAQQDKPPNTPKSRPEHNSHNGAIHVITL